MTTARLGAVVLCGGLSRRMGRDKASLPFGAETLLERVLRLVRLSAPEVVVAAAAEQAVPRGVPVSRDPSAAGGPLPALLAAIDLIQSPFVWVVACDMPLLQPALAPLLLDRAAGHDGAVPVVGGRRVPTCGVYRTDALRQARDTFGDPRNQSLHRFLASLDVREVGAEDLHTVDPELLSFTPCNTPEEYRGIVGGLEGWRA